MSKIQIIALLTDFGNYDSYVASMKGKILSLLPRACIVDISHAITPQDVDQAAYVLWSAYGDFPKRTIFVSVVDPGVGGKRNILCVEGENYKFISPDNGVLKFIFGSLKVKYIVRVDNKKYFSGKISSTFHGRDIFAPVAAHLASGIKIDKIGSIIRPVYGAEHFVNVYNKPSDYNGTVLHVDHFGNIITNFLIKRPLVNARLKIMNRTVGFLSGTYVDSRSSDPFLLVGSSGLLEVAVKNGNASKIIKTKIKQRIHLTVS